MIAIFFLLREFFCWYWKINKIVNLLEDIKNNTSAKKNIPLIQSIKTEQRIAPNQALAQEAIIKKGYLRGFFSKGNKKNQIIIELLVFGLIIVILYILLRGVFKVI